MPNFRRVHGVAAVFASVTLAIIYPAILTGLAGLRSVGLVAIAILLFGTILWLMTLRHNWLGFLMAAGIFAMISEPGRNAVDQVIFGHFEMQAAGLLTLGLAISAAGFIRLFRLNEDMLEFHYRILWDWAGRSQMSRQAWTGENRLGNWLEERQMASLTRHARRAPSSRWSRVCRWRAGMNTGWSVWLLAVFLVINAQFMAWIMPDDATIFGLMFLFLTIMPLAALTSVFFRRTQLMGYELMMPVDRRSYVKQLAAAAAWSLFQVWGVACAALVLWWLLTAAQPEQTALLMGAVAISGALQIGMFGLAALAASYRSLAIAALAVGLLFGASQIPMVMLPRTKGLYILDVVLLAGGSAVLLGLALSWVAYRHWLKMDFD